MMKMYFHFGYDETVLFKFWQTSSVAGLLLAVAVVGAIAFLTEASSHVIDYLYRRERKMNLCYDIEISPIVSQPSNGESQKSECQNGGESQSCPPSPECHPGTSKDGEALHCQPGTSKCPPTTSKCYEKCREKCIRAELPKYGLTHFATTLIYAYQTTMNVLLMLSFMTYNVWLCLAVVIGRVLGYALLHRS